VKRLGITQRVDLIVDYGERRDCLDQRWSSLAIEVGFVPVPLPNVAAKTVSTLLDALQLDAIILSGGNSLSEVDPTASDTAPERDAFEAALIEEAIRRLLPVLGVCRGIQILNVHFGGKLSRIEGHAGSRHKVAVLPAYTELIPSYINSYHNWTIAPNQLAGSLEPIVHDLQGNIEGFRHQSIPVAGIMWHPEREDPFKEQDIKLLRKFLT
jgi:N5-(cytidine 5'-diphosphoramidyl)-L-glutamine hydrolase